jgi:hypothetical protein
MPVKASAAVRRLRAWFQQPPAEGSDGGADRCTTELDQCVAGTLSTSSPAAAAAPAIAIMTTAVAMPSLRPFSTVMRCRMRDDTRGLVTTGMPRAASLGARAAPTNSASHRPSPGKNQAASAHPSRMVGAGR